MQTEKVNSPSNVNKESKQQTGLPRYILDDLCSRFIINIPEEERQDLIRIFFQIELAHWFYLDFYCDGNTELKPWGIREFSQQIFNHCPTLSHHANNVETIMASWKEYKMAVPTYGAILIDPTMQYCLLVQGFFSKASWGFPKGKVNEDEQARDCAVREVLEETGFNMENLIDCEEYVEYKMNEQQSRLYLVPGVSMDTKFQPRTRKEIKCLEWFKIDYLPNHKKDEVCKEHYGLGANSFFMVIPFVKPLKRWIQKQRGEVSGLAEHRTYTPRPRRESQSDRGSGRPRRDSHNDYRDIRQITVSSKDRQKQGFAQDMQSQLQEFMQFREPRSSIGGPGSKQQLQQQQRARSDSPQLKPSSRKHSNGRQHLVASPRSSTKKHDKHHKRENYPSNTRRSLATQFTESGQPQIVQKPRKNQREPKLWSHTWANFKLDSDAILNAMFPPQSVSNQKSV